MRLSDAVSPARPITVPFVGDVLNVEYRPMSYTPEQLDKMQADAAKAKDPKAAVAGMVDQMLKLLVSWDLTQDDGSTPIPITAEGLRGVPLNVYTEVMRAVARDQTSGEVDAPSAAG